MQRNSPNIGPKIGPSPLNCHPGALPVPILMEHHATWTHSAHDLQTKGTVSRSMGKGRHSRMSSVTSPGSALLHSIPTLFCTLTLFRLLLRNHSGRFLLRFALPVRTHVLGSFSRLVKALGYSEDILIPYAKVYPLCRVVSLLLFLALTIKVTFLFGLNTRPMHARDFLLFPVTFDRPGRGRRFLP